MTGLGNGTDQDRLQCSATLQHHVSVACRAARVSDKPNGDWLAELYFCSRSNKGTIRGAMHPCDWLAESRVFVETGSSANAKEKRTGECHRRLIEWKVTASMSRSSQAVCDFSAPLYSQRCDRSGLNGVTRSRSHPLTSVFIPLIPTALQCTHRSKQANEMNPGTGTYLVSHMLRCTVLL